MDNYPWYSLAEADEPLDQGDLISGCPIVIPKATAFEKVLRSKLRSIPLMSLS
jgi:hypothetical protein